MIMKYWRAVYLETRKHGSAGASWKRSQSLETSLASYPLFMIIGQGNTPNQLLTYNFHQTFSANGDLTAYVDNFESICR
jgi:hypothetical protein